MLRVKLTYEGEHRRCGVPKHLLSLGTLRDRGKSLFGSLRDVKPQSINFQWVDDEGDIISVSSDVEIEESVAVMGGHDGETLHYGIVTIPTPPLVSPSITRQEPNTRHCGVKCDECGMRAISGVRFKCSVRKGYNICSVCECRRPQPYPMIKIYTPQQRSDVRQWKRRLFEEGTVPPRCGFGDATNVHTNVQCDLCKAYPVTGVRYKSIMLPDYDLCEICEASEAASAAKSHPMLKIYHHGQLAAIPPPKWLVRERVVAEKKAQREQKRQQKREERQCNITEKKTKEERKRCVKPQDEDSEMEAIVTALSSAMSNSCSSVDQPCAAPSVVAESMMLAEVATLSEEEAEEVAEEDGLAVAQEANEEHAVPAAGAPDILSDPTTPVSRSADAPISSDDAIAKSKFTDTDLDLLMHQFGDSSTHRHVGGKIVCPMEEISHDTSPASIARFVCDITFPTGDSAMYPGTVFYKTWRVMNTSEVAWPSTRCMLVSAGGDRLMSGLEQERRNEVYLPQLQPNQAMDVTLQLTAPSEPGRYVAYFRFIDVELNEVDSATSASRLFGDRLFADIEVMSMEAPVSPHEEDANGWMMVDEEEKEPEMLPPQKDTIEAKDNTKAEGDVSGGVGGIRGDAAMISDAASAACGASLMSSSMQDALLSAAAEELQLERYSEAYGEWGPELDVLNSMGFEDIDVLVPHLVSVIPSQFRGNNRGGRISEEHMQQLMARLCQL